MELNTHTHTHTQRKISAWAEENTHMAHNYDIIKYNQNHQPFYGFIKSNFNLNVDKDNFLETNSKISIMDIGGGNGNVCLPMLGILEKYVCLDVNQKNREVGIDFYKNYNFMHFKQFDANVDEFGEDKFDICYIDGILQMLDDPYLILNKVLPKVNFIFLNRTNIFKTLEKKIYKWGGMKEFNFLWEFDINFFNLFSAENKCDIGIGPGFIFIKNKTNNMDVYKKELEKTIDQCKKFDPKQT